MWARPYPRGVEDHPSQKALGEIFEPYFHTRLKFTKKSEDPNEKPLAGKKHTCPIKGTEGINPMNISQD